MATERTFLETALRRDLGAFTQRCFQTVVPGQPFLPNWHIQAITHQLERCLRRETRRLIVTLPPRNLKSICASVAFPAYVLGHDPTARIVCASYSQDLTAKHARDCRAILESAWYQRLFPLTRIDSRKNRETEFETAAHGHRLGTSVGGTLTGRGGSLIILDDPLKPADAMSETRRTSVNEWYDTTLSSRLDRKTEDVIVIIMQRLHVDDLVGHVLDKEDWTHLNLPAIADGPSEVELGGGISHWRAPGDVLHPEREPAHILDELKRTMGSQTFSAQYQQAPVPPGGALIQESWFRHYAHVPEPSPGDQIVQSWDTASKVSKTNDYSACTTWFLRGRDAYLLDVFRGRLEFPDLRRKVLSHAERHCADAVLIEDASSGTQLIQDLEREGKLRPIAIKPDRDKIVRLEGRSADIEAGRVLLPESAPWLEDFLIEVLSFPFGRHDDQVDSLSQLLTWASTRRQRSFDLDLRSPLLEKSNPWNEHL